MKKINKLMVLAILSILLATAVYGFFEDFENYPLNSELNISEWRFYNSSNGFSKFVNTSNQKCLISKKLNNKFMNCSYMINNTNPSMESYFLQLNNKNSIKNYTYTFDSKYIFNAQFPIVNLFYIVNNDLNLTIEHYRCLQTFFDSALLCGKAPDGNLPINYDNGTDTLYLNDTWYHNKFIITSNNISVNVLFKKWFFNETEPNIWGVNFSDNSLPVYENGTIGFALFNTSIFVDNIFLNKTLIFKNLNWNYTTNESSNPTNANPEIIALSPSNGNMTTSVLVGFNCSASDDTGLSKVSLWGNFTGIFAESQSNVVTGLNNVTSFSEILNNGVYSWNCQAFDDINQSAFFSVNYTLIINVTTETNNTIPNNTTSENVTIINQNPLRLSYLALIILLIAMLLFSYFKKSSGISLITGIYSVYLGFYFQDIFIMSGLFIILGIVFTFYSLSFSKK